MAKTKQILIRVSEEEHRSLTAKAKTARVSIPTIIRNQLGRVKATENRNLLRLEKLLLVRIVVQMDHMAEQCRKQEDKTIVLDILTHLIGIERELKSWNEERRKP